MVAVTACTLSTDLERLGSGGAASSTSASNPSVSGAAMSTSSGSGGSGGVDYRDPGPCVEERTCEICIKAACPDAHIDCVTTTCSNILVCVYACPCDAPACVENC